MPHFDCALGLQEVAAAAEADHPVSVPRELVGHGNRLLEVPPANKYMRI